ncbi:hypothetical protein scyTo_0024978, partial [Scyliorhinus torazame]|nr:hypothetical protein [Scyliorhinus torazame]
SHFYQEKLLEELKDYKFVFPHVISGNRKQSVATLPQVNNLMAFDSLNTLTHPNLLYLLLSAAMI